MSTIAELYLEAQQRFAAEARSLSTAELRLAAPACPGWDVHDLVAHVSGVADDLVHGRVEGAATDPWTARQVERGRGVATGELLDRWDGQAAQVAGMLDGFGERRPVIDTTTHLYDLRHAVGRPRPSRDPLVATLAAWLLGPTDLPVAVEVRTEDAVHRCGPADESAVRVETASFEVFRSRLGRRSRAQVAAWPWVGDPGPVLDQWFVFGPAAGDLVEAVTA